MGTMDIVVLVFCILAGIAFAFSDLSGLIC